jgi:hypothetical protein
MDKGVTPAFSPIMFSMSYVNVSLIYLLEMAGCQGPLWETARPSGSSMGLLAVEGSYGRRIEQSGRISTI